MHLAQLRSDSGRCSPADVENFFFSLAITPPSRISNVIAALETTGFVSRSKGRGSVWALTPEGRQRLLEIDIINHLDALLPEIEVQGFSVLGGMVHPLLPPSIAPPEIERGLRDFLRDYPFETNVFGMTRFPEEDDDDPVTRALSAVRDACDRHGLSFHLASDRAISDDLWANVSAHMWASKYGIAFFEDRRARGVNYNMTIEIGSMLMTGRRCALLKDISIASLPTDLVGHIYKAVDIDDHSSVARAVHSWIRDDLRLGSCSACSSVTTHGAVV
jgi:DNA-binding transcriptional LysR family regulator